MSTCLRAELGSSQVPATIDPSLEQFVWFFARLD
jgi:hypothetical protein